MTLVDSETRLKQISRKTVWIILLIFTALIVMGRIRLSDAPLHSDICAYAMIGHEMIHGRQLYTDLWERKPPLLYATFAAAEMFAGYGPNQIFLINLITPLASLLLIYHAGRPGPGGTLAALIAAAFWTLLCADLDLAANQPDPEVFINIFLVAAVGLLLNWPARRWLLASLLLGTLFTAATFYKHNVVIVCIALAGGHVLATRSNSGWSRRVSEAAISGAVVLCGWMMLFGYFAAQHRFHDMIEVLFHQNVAYSGNVMQNISDSTELRRLFPPFMIWALGPIFLLLALIAFVLLRRKTDLLLDRRWIICLSWAIGIWPTVALTGKIYPHYYQLWIPIGCIVGGWAAAALLQSELRVPSFYSYGAVISVFVILAFRQGRDFLLTPEEWVHQQFPYFDFVEKTDLGNRLGQLLKPDEQFWELGEDNDLYFLSRHSPPTGLLYIDPLIYGDNTAVYWHRLMGDLQRAQPALVIQADSWTPFFRPDAPIFSWLRQNYALCNTPFGWPHYQMWVHAGGDLEKRLKSITLQPRSHP